MKMNILSIDWDFFFPDFSGFDWGADDDTHPHIEEFIWYTRFYNRNYSTGQYAYQLRPKFESFLEWIKGRVNFDRALITDSHKSILKAIKPGAAVWNFDQHHDAGYYREKGIPKVFDSGNWALHSYIEKYNLIYPEWRKVFKEPSSDLVEYGVSYWGDEVVIPRRFDILFICRSGAWTPPWCDRWWIEFVHAMRSMFYTKGCTVDAELDVLEPRKFDELKAAELAGEWGEYWLSKKRS